MQWSSCLALFLCREFSRLDFKCIKFLIYCYSFSLVKALIKSIKLCTFNIRVNLSYKHYIINNLYMLLECFLSLVWGNMEFLYSIPEGSFGMFSPWIPRALWSPLLLMFVEGNKVSDVLRNLSARASTGRGGSESLSWDH